MTKNFTGLYTAIITPFVNGKVDKDALEKIVEMQVAAGVDGIVPVGSTGESSTLTPEEHRDTIRTVIEIVNNRIMVMAGSGSNSTAEAIQYSKDAEEDGADALLIITPYCNKPSQKGLFAHYTEIAKEVSIPIIMYNVPGRTGVVLEAETTIELSKNPLIQGIKDASSNFESITRVIKEAGENFCMLSGNDDETLKIIQAGGVGIISVASNATPRQLKEFVDLCLAGNWERAEELQNKYSQFWKDLFIETNPLPVKTLMSHLGYCNEEFRLPLTTMYEDKKSIVLKTWEDLNITSDEFDIGITA